MFKKPRNSLLLVALLILSTLTTSIASAQGNPEQAERYKNVLEEFARGQSLIKTCEYAVADPSAYGRCTHEVIWRCQSNATGCLKAVPKAVSFGAEYEEFIAENKVNVGDIPMDIDQTVVATFGGSLKKYCNFWKVDCTRLISWYKNPKWEGIRKGLNLTAHE